MTHSPLLINSTMNTSPFSSMARKPHPMKKISSLSLLSVFIFNTLFLNTLYANTPTSPTTCDMSDYLTGNWGGARCDLEDHGVTLNSTYITDAMDNFSGGRSQGFSHTDSLSISANFDLEKIMHWTGAEFFIDGTQGDGQEIAAKYIGSVFSPMEIYTTNSFMLNNLYYKQFFKINKNTFFKLGRLASDDDFATNPIYSNFVSAEINANPGVLFFNSPFSADSGSQWGAYGQVQAENFITKLAVYNTSDQVRKTEYHGTYFNLESNNGALLMLEEDYEIGENFIKLPAEYSLGALYVTGNNQIKYQTNQKISGNYGAYIQLIQQFTRPNGISSTQGLSGFISLVAFPSDRNQFPFYGQVGLSDEGLIKNRPLDSFNIAYLYGKFSQDYSNYQVSQGLLNQTYEAVYEINYKIQWAPWSYIQPDLQIIQNPGGAHQYHNAWVAGTEFGVSF